MPAVRTCSRQVERPGPRRKIVIIDDFDADSALLDWFP